MTCLRARCFLLIALLPTDGAEGQVLNSSSNGCRYEVSVELETLRIRARDFYLTGSFDFDDAARVGHFLEGLDDWMALCPAAVLQAVLLKLEENMVYVPGAFEDLMAAYVRYMQAAIRQGTITALDLELWPLNEGVDRVQMIHKKLQQRRPLTSAMVMNFCKAADRFGEVHELQWLLEPPFGYGQRNLTVEHTPLLKGTDVYIYLVDKPWCVAPSDKMLRRLRTNVRSLHVIPYMGGPGREEQSAYFKFIVDHWLDMPDFVIFTHPDAPEHMGMGMLTLMNALKLVRTQSEFAWESIGYYPLSLQMVVDPSRTWSKTYFGLWAQFWQRVFGQSWHEVSRGPPRCRWEDRSGTYLAGYLPGFEHRQTRKVAKAACEEREDCMGVTCGSPLSFEEESALLEQKFRHSHLRICTMRQGPLYESPSNEVSYVRTCAPAGESAHDDAVLAMSPAAAEAERVRDETYSLQAKRFLLDYAAGDASSRSVPDARARCNELGSQCGGFTCGGDASPNSSMCTVRAGSDAFASPSEEFSYIKVAPSTQLEAAVRRPTAPGAGGTFQAYMGSQSIIRKDRILAWSLEEFAAFASDGDFCSRHTGHFEAAWPRMFGEHLSQWPREDDPRLPLFLKWSQITLYSFGDERVI